MASLLVYGDCTSCDVEAEDSEVRSSTASGSSVNFGVVVGSIAVSEVPLRRVSVLRVIPGRTLTALLLPQS